ncbi:MAG: Gfo/Idh/MocA family oxidoreductase [Chloroflexota bacterium]|nr:Gfo/Idh/MocA family oxidoreductase [Chloroflexota bacterium]MDE2909632.1 Gfo/Idh/MocA family oxidoreductase [Chloroflexota bacterium]
MTLRAAFSGTGHISQVHARAAQSIAGVELAAIVNHRPESMRNYAAQFGIARQYATVEDLLRDGEVDMLVVSTPNYLHAPQTIAALEGGVHVMVEKPMAMNSAEAERMLAASQDSGAKLMVAHCWRFDEEVNWIKAQIDRGRLGDVLRTKGYGVHVNWGPGGWFVEARYAGGGALADMGIHAIDVARYLLGDPQPLSVYAQISTDYTKYEVDDSGTIWVNWMGGATSIVESGWWWPHADGPEASTKLYGTKAFAQLFPTRLEVPDRETQTVQTIDPGYPPAREEQCPQIMYDRQLAHFIKCIREDRTPNPGGVEGLTNMRIIDAALESSRAGQVVRL